METWQYLGERAFHQLFVRYCAAVPAEKTLLCYRINNELLFINLATVPSRRNSISPPVVPENGNDYKTFSDKVKPQLKPI